MKKVSLIIPCYNEEEVLGILHEELKKVTGKMPKYDFEFLFVNDGSKDSTYSVCEKNKYNIIDLPINLGLAGGFQAGAKYAYLKGYDCFIQFDADGQHLWRRFL